MTKQEIYEQVVQLTSELHTVGVAEKIFSAAKTGDASNVESVFETFKKENPELYQRTVSFGEKINEFTEIDAFLAEIWGYEENEEGVLTVFDINTIDAPTLYVLSFFANIDESCFFEWGSKPSETFVEAIKDAGYQKLSDFVVYQSWKDQLKYNQNYDTLYELLIAIFNGELEEEFEE